MAKISELPSGGRAGRFGLGSDYCNISTGGKITYAGTGKGSLVLRPTFNTGFQKTTAKPAEVVRSSVIGYSLPIYNSDNEEMFFRDIVPGRWDGTTNVTFYLIGYLASANSTGKKFRLQVSVEATDGVTGICDQSPVDADSGDITLTTGHNAQYSWHTVPVTILAATLVGSREAIHWRVRRIAANDSANEITGNFVITNWYCKYTVDKVYSA